MKKLNWQRKCVMTEQASSGVLVMVTEELTLKCCIHFWRELIKLFLE